MSAEVKPPAGTYVVKIGLGTSDPVPHTAHVEKFEVAVEQARTRDVEARRARRS